MNHTSGSRSRARLTIALLSAAVLFAGACGSTKSSLEKQAANGVPQADATGATSAAAPTDQGTTAVPAADQAAGPSTPAPTSPGAALAGGTPAAANAAGTAKTPAAAVTTSTIASRSAAGAQATPKKGATNEGVATPSPGAAPAPVTPAAGDGPEVVIGSIGTRSGVIGGILSPIEQGAKAWAADVNGRGGLNGRKVRLVLGDDQGDPNKAVSLVRRMVDQDKVVAFYAEQGPGTLQAVMPYLEQKQIPMLTVCNCSDGAAQSPMAFNSSFGGYLGMTWSHLMPAKLSGAKKASLMACRELSICQRIKKQIREGLAASVGLEIVHDADISLAQPDMTAEVLGARNAGAEVLIIMADNFTVVRVARSAHRQNYDPKIAFQMTGHDERFLKDGGGDIEGAIFGSSSPDWNLPVMAEFKAAAARTGAVLSSMTATSWIAGKLMEAVAKSFPPSGPVGSADFLRGLYGLKGETVGGLTPPLTYKEGTSHDPSNQCIFPVTAQKGKFVTLNGGNYVCPPGWQPVQK